MPALSRASRDPAGTAHVSEALFPRASRPLRSHTLALLCRRVHLCSWANLLSAVARRTSATLDSCGRHCILLTKRLVVSGHLSTSSALLLIDLSAEPVESSLPCSWQTLSPLHAGTRPCEEGSFCHPRHRRLTPPDSSSNSRKLDVLCDHFRHTCENSWLHTPLLDVPRRFPSSPGTTALF